MRSVIVLGGGAAGLAAACSLAEAGHVVTLIEARDRLGGRIDTRQPPGWPVAIERGAEFIHGRPPETWDLLRQAGLAACDVTSEHWIFSEGHLRRRPEIWDEADSLLSRLGQQPGPDRSFADFLAGVAHNFSPLARRMATMYVEGFNAADAARISVESLVAEEAAGQAIEGDRLFRVVGGYGGIVAYLEQQLRSAGGTIHLGTVAIEVQWRPGAVSVQTTNATGLSRPFTADAAVISLPLGVLQAAGVRFQPELTAKRTAYEKLVMGPVVKVVLRFREPFWQEADEDLGFFHDPAGWFPTWWTALPLRASTLTAWAGGPAAERLATSDQGQIVGRALKDLDRMFARHRPVERLLEAAEVCDWQRDPFARGAYSYVAAGGIDGPALLAAPLEDTLFFAGEATHPGMSGTVAGALASGLRAAREIAASKTKPR
ncbi:MAG TPA: NAD(P)/FAD-dependent oxidoreductase [Pirellulales bacterium]|nr:NAD(P)/FAD-dependent oxidoreductase [Pirellulales bacterium]